jgi:hypothetical protein
MESQRDLALNTGEQLIANATYFKKIFERFETSV